MVELLLLMEPRCSIHPVVDSFESDRIDRDSRCLPVTGFEQVSEPGHGFFFLASRPARWSSSANA